MKQFGVDLARQLSPVAIHGITTIVVILFMALAEATLNFTMGHDARIYDAIPLRYFVQTIDLVVIVRFTSKIWREFR